MAPVLELVLEEVMELVLELVMGEVVEMVEDVMLLADDVEELTIDVVPTEPVLHKEAGGAEKESHEPPRSVPVLKSSCKASAPLPLTTSIFAE